ncbi:MAG: serine/threonine-protein kinase, partial [Gemmataceae bacterium]
MAAPLHPSFEELVAFDQGKLATVRLRTIEDHVAGCAECCRKLEEVPDDRLIALLRGLPVQETREWCGDNTPQAGWAGHGELPRELRDHPRYRVLELLGVGGMGAVYKAQHLLMERTVALKTIRTDLTARPQVVERFRQEVRAAAQLAHPNIVHAFDAEQAGDLHFLVMEYVTGEALDKVVAEHGALDFARACDYVRQAARGLQQAHERGMVHRDIKPSNLIVTRVEDGTQIVKFLDFGLARLLTSPRDVEGPENREPSAFGVADRAG